METFESETEAEKAWWFWFENRDQYLCFCGKEFPLPAPVTLTIGPYSHKLCSDDCARDKLNWEQRLADDKVRRDAEFEEFLREYPRREPSEVEMASLRAGIVMRKARYSQ